MHVKVLCCMYYPSLDNQICFTDYYLEQYKYSKLSQNVTLFKTIMTTKLSEYGDVVKLSNNPHKGQHSITPHSNLDA